MKTFDEIANGSADYSEYTAQIFSDPSYYGSECTEADAQAITEKLIAMIKRQFPGIEVKEWRETTGGSASTQGPDESLCEEIRSWISDNWTKAL